jgi:manganese/zinc/iron transport system permease protein
MLLLAGAFGLIAAVLGASLSATLPTPAGSVSRGWPTGHLIVLCAAAIFLLSALVAPRRGLFARLRAGRAEILAP